MAVLAVVAVAAWPHPPAPLAPAAAWSQRAAPVVDALALDVSSATALPRVSPALARRLAHDLSRAGGVGVPPDPARAAVWRNSLAEVRAALSYMTNDPSAARSALNLAGLQISGLSAAAQSQ